MLPASFPELSAAAAHPGTPAVLYSHEGPVAVVRGGTVRSYIRPRGLPGARLRLRSARPASPHVLAAADSLTGLGFCLPCRSTFRAAAASNLRSSTSHPKEPIR